jgi:guanidinobutyrase / D-arginase
MTGDIMRLESGTVVPRYAGASTFVRLPELRDVETCDVAVLGIPFDSGVSYGPDARFGPAAVRQASRMFRPQFHPSYGVEPLAGDHTVVLPMLRSVHRRHGPVALVHLSRCASKFVCLLVAAGGPR